ncbi:MAG: class I SAM-dependent methyltransferase [Candidatus Altiarchaeota archaeon]
MNDLEQVKNFWERNLCLDKFLKERYLTKEYFEESTRLRYKYHHHIPPLVDRMKKKYPKKNPRLLEIGVGMGTDLQLFSENGFDVSGIDLTEKAIVTSKARFSMYGLDSNLMTGNAEQLTFEDDSFDIVYSFGVLHHTPDIIKACHEIHRVLKPEGTFLLMLYNSISLNRFAHWVTGIGFDGSKNDPCPIERSYTKSEVMAMLSFFERIDISVDYLFGTGWGKANLFFPKVLHRTLGKIIGWHLIIEAEK